MESSAEAKQIRLDEKTLFEFGCNLENNHLKVTLSEIDSSSPSLYAKNLTLEEFHKINPSFKSCDSLEKVKSHMDAIFQSKKVKISQPKENEINLTFQIYIISNVEEFHIILEKK